VAVIAGGCRGGEGVGAVGEPWAHSQVWADGAVRSVPRRLAVARFGARERGARCSSMCSDVRCRRTRGDRARDGHGARGTSWVVGAWPRAAGG
jgi:hypothetical protein